jgi:hypothetical protein
MDHPLTAILVSHGGPLQVHTVTKTVQTIREFKDSEVIQFLEEWLWILYLTVQNKPICESIFNAISNSAYKRRESGKLKCRNLAVLNMDYA